jgi:UDP-apiose/xylose synthase
MALRRIAVLGAGGFVGSHLVPALIEHFDCRVDAVDVDFRKLATHHPRVRRIQSRIEEPGLAERIAGGSDVVVSLTALCTPALYSSAPLAVIDANYTHLVPLVQACAKSGAHLIHFSTSEVYGRMALDHEGRRTRTMNEDSTAFFLGPVSRERWTYACAKQLLERVIWAHGLHGDLRFTIVRPFNVIGPRMDFVAGVDGEGIPRVLASFMSALLRGQELLLVDGGTQRRTFMAVSELVDAVCRIIQRVHGCAGQILNLGNPANDVSIRELGQLLARAFAEVVPHAEPARFRDVSAEELYGAGYDDSDERVPDIDRARLLLQWEPRLRLSEMLPDIVRAYVTEYDSLLAPPARAARKRAGAR